MATSQSLPDGTLVTGDAPQNPPQGQPERIETNSSDDANNEREPSDAPSTKGPLPGANKETQSVDAAPVRAEGEQSEARELDENDEDCPASPDLQDETANETTGTQKRSRSGSIKRSSSSPLELPTGPRETSLDKVLLEQYLHREWLHTALAAGRSPRQDIIQEKRAERDFYLQIQHERQVNPGAIFGMGYEGFGNARTDLKAQHPQLLYPSNRRKPGGRKSRDFRIPRAEMATQAEQSEHLVPIRLDIDWDKVKIRDTFTWNLHDRVTPPDVFAEKLVEDFGLTLESSGPLVRLISQSIQDQLTDYYPHVFIEEEPLDSHQPYFAYKDDEMRVLLKLNITIGQHTLVDQFEWDINNPYNSPEEFAIQMATDLALSGEFMTAIAHSIREQIQLFTRSLFIVSHPFDGRPIEDPDLKQQFQPSPLPSTFRPYQQAKEFMPYLYELNEAGLERAEGNISREQRRQKRSINRRGGPALPDLKDRQRTIRTMIVSSVIPGAATSLEESRIFKRSGTGRSRRAAAGQRDGLEDSDDSDSDESSAASPAMSHLAQGTARTRTMRTASAIAQSAMRNHLARSATPETSGLLETRTSARRREYREETPDMPDKLIITLRINSHKLRQLLRDMKTGQRAYTSSPAVTKASTPARTTLTAPRGSMPPPLMSQTATATATTPTPTPNVKKPQPSQINGAVDAPHPPQPGVPGVRK